MFRIGQGIGKSIVRMTFTFSFALGICREKARQNPTIH